MIAALTLIAWSCKENEETVAGDTSQVATVNVHVNNFSVSQEDFPTSRAEQSIAEYSGIKAITLAFYKSDGTQQSCTTQLKADNTTYTTFGNFSLELPVGSYKMIVLGYGSDYPMVFNSMTDVTFGEEKTRETFSYTQDVVISNAAANDLTGTLQRINSRLHVISTDGRPADATKVRITFAAGGKGFNPLTGLATTDAGFTNVIDFASTAAGEVSKSRADLFLTTDEQTMSLTIETLDDDGYLLFSKVVSNVPFKRNRITSLTGSMYSPGSVSATFSVETDWETDYEMTF